MTLPYCRKPCIECPWRRDAVPGKFSSERYIKLAVTAYDMSTTIFACHMTNEGKEVACAGFIISQGAHNLSLRMARQPYEARADAPLFYTYRELAIANGVPENHPALRNCRDDGQTGR